MFFFQLPYLPELLVRKTGKLTLRRTSLPGTFGAADLERYRGAWEKPGAMEAMIHWYRAAARGNGFRSSIDPTVDVPTLVIWGEQDAFLDRRMAESSLALCREGELVRLPGITHWVQHEAAEQANRLLIRHFR